MEIRNISKDEVREVVSVHNLSFKKFFLTELGDNFLHTYYDSIRKNTNGILLGIFEDGSLAGFAAAATHSKGFNRRLIKSSPCQFGFIALKLSLTRMPALIRLLRNFSKKKEGANDSEDYAELFSIGVNNNQQGKGIGKKLLLELEHHLRFKGCHQLSLTTDYYNNDKAIGFYRSLGYEIMYDFVTYPNRKMYRMIKKINININHEN